MQWGSELDMIRKETTKRKEVERKEVTLQQESKSKWKRQVNRKKKEKWLLVLACHLPNTTCTYSLSFTLMVKTKTKRGKKQQLQFLTTKQQIQLYSLDIFF